MTNWEKYKDELLKISTTSFFAVKDGEVVPCSKCNCKECFFNDESTSKGCNELRLEWLDEEYKEPSPYENWEIDDKIEVSNDGNTWQKRYFAGIDENGNVLAWTGGLTSWNTISKSVWEFARKVEE